MAAPLWTLICQSKSDYIQAVAQEIIKIWIFYIYMNIYCNPINIREPLISRNSRVPYIREIKWPQKKIYKFVDKNISF